MVCPGFGLHGVLRIDSIKFSGDLGVLLQCLADEVVDLNRPKSNLSSQLQQKGEPKYANYTSLSPIPDCSLTKAAETTIRFMLNFCFWFPLLNS